MRQTLEALWFEGILDYTLSGEKWQTYGVDLNGQPVEYVCQAEEKFSFGRIKIVPHSLQRAGEPCHDPYLFLTELVHNKLRGERLTVFIGELLETLAKDSQSLEILPEYIAETERHYEALESHMTEGHPYHPAYKSRLGFTLSDNRRYGPEFNQRLDLFWVAVREGLVDTSVSAGYTVAELYKQHLTAGDIERFGQILEQAGVQDQQKYVMIPVHPWQWEQRLETIFTSQRLSGEMIPLGFAEGQYRAQQSIRTWSHRGNDKAPYLKLSLGITNTSSGRILAYHTTQNAPLISDWLEQLVREDELLQQEQFAILKEVLGISFRYDKLLPIQQEQAYGSLGTIWRENVALHLTEGEEAWPLNAVSLVQKNGEPLIHPFLLQHGVTAWAKSLIRVLTVPMIHLLYAHGLALEAHAQNIILVLENGWPKRMIVKDLHDGVRFVPGKLCQPDLAPKLHPEPEVHRQFNRYSFIHAETPADVRDYVYDAFFFICMSEIAWMLQGFGLAEQQFWTWCRETIVQYQEQFPEYGEAFKEYNLFAGDALIEEMTKRRLYGDGELYFRKVRNPLLWAKEVESL